MTKFKLFIGIISILFAISECKSQQFVQIQHPAYELSAICKDNRGNIIVSSDEGRIDYWDLQSGLLIPIAHASKGKDFEALYYYQDSLWVALEEPERRIEYFKISTSNSNPSKIPVDLNKAIAKGIPETTNNTLEAFVIDEVNDKLYFAKEYEKRAVFEYDLKNKSVKKLTIYNNIDTVPLDVTDMKLAYNDKNEPLLYLLERYDRQIRSYNLKTKEVQITPFKHLVCDQEYSLFSEQGCGCLKCYGRAEALLLTENEIWIGFDNGGNPINQKFSDDKKLGISGDRPVILKLKRTK